MHTWALCVAAAVGAMLASSDCLAQSFGSAGKEPPAQVSPASTSSAPEFATADDLLRALETADRDLKSLSCELLWTKDFLLGGDSQTRKGKLFFVDQREAATPKGSPKPGSAKDSAAPEPSAGRRKFAVKIEATVTQGSVEGEGRLDRRLQEYVFDGLSLIERFPEEKRTIRHQLQAKANADPLRIGEGPIPLPVGQNREDILARFNVELLSAEQDLVPKDVDQTDPAAQRLKVFAKGCVQLKLVPKPEYEKECTFKQARLWYKRTDGAGGALLPRMARAIDKQDNTDTVMLSDVQVNGPVGEVFDTSVPEGWDVQVMGAGNGK